MVASGPSTTVTSLREQAYIIVSSSLPGLLEGPAADATGRPPEPGQAQPRGRCDAGGRTRPGPSRRLGVSPLLGGPGPSAVASASPRTRLRGCRRAVWLAGPT